MYKEYERSSKSTTYKGPSILKLTEQTTMIEFFKRKKILVTNKGEFEKTLTRLIELLRDNAFNAQADAVRSVLAALSNNDTDKFLKRINSVDIWGGAGAVWEVSGFQTKQDEKEFWVQIIRLTDLMREINIKNGRAYQTAKIFRKELKARSNYTMPNEPIGMQGMQKTEYS